MEANLVAAIGRRQHNLPSRGCLALATQWCELERRPGDWAFGCPWYRESLTFFTFSHAFGRGVLSNSLKIRANENSWRFRCKLCSSVLHLCCIALPCRAVDTCSVFWLSWCQRRTRPPGCVSRQVEFISHQIWPPLPPLTSGRFAARMSHTSGR